MTTFDFSAFQKKPIKSTATPFDFSAFQKQPIKPTATPLNLSAFQPKERTTLPKADISGGIKKIIAGKGVISLFKAETAPITYQKALQQGYNKFKKQFSIADASTPEGKRKIADLAFLFMPIGDIVSIGNKIPKGKVIDIVGDTKDLVVQQIKNVFNKISKTDNTQIIVKALQKGIGGETKALNEIATKLKDITDPIDVAQIIKNNSKLDIKLPVDTTALSIEKRVPVGFEKEVEVFTKQEQATWNSFTHFPKDFNKEYISIISEAEKEAISKLGDKLPKEISDLLLEYNKKAEQWLRDKGEQLIKAPSPSVVGPARYNVSRSQKARSVYEEKSKQFFNFEDKLQRKINQLSKEKTKSEFGALSEIDKVKANIKSLEKQIAGLNKTRDTWFIEKGNKQIATLQKKLTKLENQPKPTPSTTLTQEAKKAISEGKSIDELVNASKKLLKLQGEAYTPGQTAYITRTGNKIAQSSPGQHSLLAEKVGFKGENAIENYLKNTGDVRIIVRPKSNEINISFYKKLTDIQINEIKNISQGKTLIFDNYSSKKLISGEGFENFYTQATKKITKPIPSTTLKTSGKMFEDRKPAEIKEIYDEAKGVTSKEILQKKPETKPIVKSEVPEKDFLVQNSLTKSVEQKVQTVKEITKGLDPAEVKEIKLIPEKTVEVMVRQEIEPKFLSPNEVEYLANKQTELSFIEDQISQHPARGLKKYFSYKTGSLPEVLGGGTSKFGKSGDDIVTELGYENSEDARADIHNLFTLEARVKDLKVEIKELSIAEKDEIALQKFLTTRVKDLKVEIKELSIAEKDEIALQKFLTKRAIKVGKTKVIVDTSLTTRKIKQRPHYQSFIKYAEKHIIRDIHPPILNRHITMTAERVAEYLDEGIGGRVYREIVKPVYKSAVEMTKELAIIKDEVKRFRIIEGSIDDRNASLFAQKKLDTASDKAKNIAKYSRDKYDEWLVRMNETRAKMGVEPIPKRKDYITHINEVNVLTELLGGVDRITVKHRISRLKNEMLDRDANLSPIVAFERAKRQVENTTGIEQYIDARQPIFKYAKRRLGEYEKNPSVIRSLNAYSRSAMRYIYQAENVAKNKAYKDVLPANAKQFFRLWNTEQVAGRTPSSVMNPLTKRIVNAVRGTLGANTILGNMATTVMQLTSFPQVVALAGARNTMFGIITRLSSYFSKTPSKYSLSRTKTLRDLDIDFGMGNSLIDSLFIKVGEIEKVRNTAARTRLTINFGREMLMGIMQTADQFTVGASFEAFYRKGILEGLKPEKAIEYADIMTGKTQANYYKEALPPFLNTVGGKVLGQFGTYSFNQWEMFRKDFGKALKLDTKSPKEVKLLFKHFIYALVGAYLVDMVSEDVFGRQPYDIKDLVDEGIAMTQGKTDIQHLVEQGKETAMSYIPFLGSVKFKSMPPVLDFGSDLIQFALGSDPMKTAKAKKDLEERWALSVMLPYGGNQVRKTIQGVGFEDEDNIEKVKALLFGKWATQQGQQFFEHIKQSEITKNKIDKAIKDEDYSKLSEEEKTSTSFRNGIRDKYSFDGAITSDENILKIQELPKETQELFISTYAETTQKTINRNLTKAPKTLEHKKRLFKEKIKTALKNGTLTTDEAIEKIKQFKSIIEKLEE